MDLVTFLRILLRRWDVVLPGFLLTLVTTFAAGGSVTPAYEAQGSLLLFGPATGTSPRGTAPINPYLNFNSSLESTAVIIAESMSSEEIVRQLADLGATAGYEVTATQKTPILTVSARGSSEAQVRHTAQLVLQRVQDELAARQQAAGAPANTLIRSQVLSPPRVSVQAGNKSRVMAAVAVLGLGTTVLLAFAVENLAAWRQRWRQSAPPPSVRSHRPRRHPTRHLAACGEPRRNAGGGPGQRPPATTTVRSARRRAGQGSRARTGRGSLGRGNPRRGAAGRQESRAAGPARGGLVERLGEATGGPAGRAGRARGAHRRRTSPR